jgi:3-oxoacyl-[acyl-carrier-protein] synthase II
MQAWKNVISGRPAFCLEQPWEEAQILEELDRLWVKNGQSGLIEDLIVRYTSNNLSVNVAAYFSFDGFNAVMPTACSSANYATGYGFDLIRQGEGDMFFCGGVDAFSRVAFTGFNRLLAMAPENASPLIKTEKA